MSLPVLAMMCDSTFSHFSAVSNNVWTRAAECQETEMCVHFEISIKANRQPC